MKSNDRDIDNKGWNTVETEFSQTPSFYPVELYLLYSYLIIAICFPTYYKQDQLFTHGTKLAICHTVW